MNFKHLRYFWAAAKAGGVMRAGEQLHTTPQTLSGQINQLEEWLGHELFRKRGRELELTNEGRIALGYAEQIFALSDGFIPITTLLGQHPAYASIDESLRSVGGHSCSTLPPAHDGADSTGLR